MEKTAEEIQALIRGREVEFDEVIRSIASYKGHLRHGHTYRLQQKVFHDFVLRKERKNATGRERRVI